MCHKLVQTAVGRLHFAVKMVGEAEPPSPSALAPMVPDVSSRALGGPQFAPPSPPLEVFFWVGGESSFATKYFNWAFSGPFQICHLLYFTNSWLWRDGHFREFPLWSRNPLNLSLAAQFCSLNLSPNDRFADRNRTRPHPTVFPWPATPNASFHSGEMRLTP